VLLRFVFFFFFFFEGFEKFISLRLNSNKHRELGCDHVL